LGPPN